MPPKKEAKCARSSESLPSELLCNQYNPQPHSFASDFVAALKSGGIRFCEECFAALCDPDQTLLLENRLANMNRPKTNSKLIVGFVMMLLIAYVILALALMGNIHELNQSMRPSGRTATANPHEIKIDSEKRGSSASLD